MDVGELLRQVKEGGIELHEAEELLKKLPYEDLGYAKLDFHRKLRTGFGETVFCQGKPDAYLADIYQRIYERDGEVLGTRATEEQYELVDWTPRSTRAQSRRASPISCSIWTFEERAPYGNERYAAQ